MSLQLRAESVAWEPLPLPPDSQSGVWLWYRPAHAPHTVAVHIAPELFAEQPARVPSVRWLAESAGLGPDEFTGWVLFGQIYPSLAGTNPLLDLPVPPAPPGIEPGLALWTGPLPVLTPGVPFVPPVEPQWNAAAATGLHAMPMSFPVAGGDMTGQGEWLIGASPNVEPAAGSATARPAFVARLTGGNAEPALRAIQETWNSILHLETQLRTIRMQLDSAAGKVNTLNRDLNADERRFADNLDKKDWQDARRWLRDAQMTIHRFSKEIDLGAVSSAGRRNWFEEIVRNYVEPMLAFEGIEQVQIEFEQHHKQMHHLVNNAQSALAKAGRDAEQRANRVLQRIATKVRTSQSKRH